MPIKKTLVISNQNTEGPMDDGNAPPDHLQPFMLDVSQLRGRIVRLPQVANDILAAHNYPPAISRLLAEALCLTTLLAGMLKFDGIFTLQLKGQGALKTMVCDITTGGMLRGYAYFSEEKLAALGAAPDLMTLAVKGYLAFTVDQANSAERYQGITELAGSTLTEAVQHYFRQSEQIDTGFVTQIDQDKDGAWKIAGILLQQLAREGGTPLSDTDEDAWRRSMMLLNTLQPGELLDEVTPLNTILYKLFHEEGIRVFPPLAITKGCRCSIDKIRTVIDGLSVDEQQEYADNGVITVTCEFCNKHYEIPVASIDKGE